MKTIEERQKLFENPTGEYRAKPFWSWNGKLDKEELKRQIEIMKEMGFGGYFMHSRTGLETEYLGEEWFSLINACADDGYAKGMEAWIYDEDRWPSGSAGGLVTQDIQYRAMYLEMICRQDTEWKTAIRKGNTVAVFACVLNDGIYQNARELCYGDVLLPEETALVFRIRYSELKEDYNGFCYLNTMNRAATEKFLDATHEQYRKKCEDRLGSRIRGVFTDEPHRGGLFTDFAEGEPNAVPYTPGLFNEFEKRFGYPLKEHLPELFLRRREKDISKVTRDYVELCQELFLENFAQPYQEWCRKHQMIFTGHALHENSLSTQTVPQGSLMRFYEYMDYPGIDLLGEPDECHWIAKQVDSVARQLDKKKVLSEMYACIGWQATFETYKNVGDWQTLFGVNFRCPHLSWYTMKGQSKRDYPASILHQSGWYPEYHYVEDYFARIHAALDGRKAVTELLVLNPIESVWARAYAGAFQGIKGKDSEILRLEQQYADTFRFLQENRIDFDYGEEDLLCRHGRIEDGKLWIGSCSYRKVLVSGMDIMRGTTLKILQKLKAMGGTVIFAGAVPTYIDTLPSTEAEDFAKDCRMVPFEKNAVADACSCGREVLAEGEGSEKLYARIFEGEKDCMILLLNMDRKQELLELTICLGEGETVERWNPRNGKITVPPYWKEDGKLKLRIDLEGGGERLYRITEEKRELPVQENQVWGDLQELPTQFSYELTEPNICVLDQVKIRPENGKYISKREVLKADQALRDQMGLPHRGGTMLQPWYQKKHCQGQEQKGQRIELIYQIESEICPKKTVLVTESLSEISKITVNGQEVSLESQGHWIDCCFDELFLPEGLLQKGSNEIVIRMRYNQTSGLEAVYLLGDFGVWIDGEQLRIDSLPEKLSLGDVSVQGLPFYSGTIKYVVNALKEVYAKVRLQGFGGALAKLQGYGENEETILAFRPYEGAICGLQNISIVLTRRNTFGPFHRPLHLPGKNEPLYFVTEGEQWTEDYVLVKQGLLKMPEIRLEEKQWCKRN